MNILLLGITLAQGNYSLYLPFLVLLLGVIYWGFAKRRKIIFLLTARAPYFIRNYSLKKHVLKLMLLSLGFIALFIALLRPRWGKKEDVVRQEGRDILVCFDISRSMLAQDCLPNRLEVAKAKVQKLLGFLPCERMGLILFAESALVQCPLTRDHAAFLMFLNFVDVHTVAQGSTLISQAVKKGIEVYKSFPAKKTKLMLICTDGEDFSPNLEQLRKQAQEEGLAIITLGIGTIQGAPVPILDNEGNVIGHQKDEQGSVVVSRLNQPILESLSHDVGGVYVNICNDTDDDLREIVAYVNKFEKEHIEERHISELQEQYRWFAAISFFCFIIEWLL